MIEWGYTHAERTLPITPDGRTRNSFPTKDEAQGAMENDLRWRPDTFLVSREVTDWLPVSPVTKGDKQK